MVLITVIILTWQALSVGGTIPPYILPSPLNIINAICDNIGVLLRQTAITSLEAVSGFVAALIVAVVVAVAVVELPIFDRAITPFLAILQSIPVIAIAPLLVLWFGPGILGRILMAALVAFFPIALNLIAGLRSAEPDAAMLMSLLRAKRLHRYWYLQVPAASPFAFSGFKTGAALSIVGAIVAEFLVPVAGLGQVIVVASYQFNTALMFAAVTLIATLAVMFVGALRLIEAHVVFWHPSMRAHSDHTTATAIRSAS
jgi:NitT/TauT family transport system permease protein